MSSSYQSPPEVPPGIDPAVQLKINELFARPSAVNDTIQVVRKKANKEAVASPSNALIASPRESMDAQTSNRTLSPSRESGVKLTHPGGKMNEENDQGIWHECTLWVPPPLPRPQAVERFADPWKVRRSKTSTQKPILDVLPSKIATSIPSLPPTSSPALFHRVVAYIGSYFTTSPEIIEYSNAKFQRKAQVSIEAQERFAPSAETKGPIVRVFAILTEDVSPVGAGGGGCEMIERPVEIWAKHKRVKKIMRETGCYVTEEVYRKEIRAALTKLKE